MFSMYSAFIIIHAKLTLDCKWKHSEIQMLQFRGRAPHLLACHTGVLGLITKLLSWREKTFMMGLRMPVREATHLCNF